METTLRKAVENHYEATYRVEVAVFKKVGEFEIVHAVAIHSENPESIDFVRAVKESIVCIEYKEEEISPQSP